MTVSPSTGSPTTGPPSRRPVDIDALVDGVRAGDRATLAKAITLVESTRPDHQIAAQELLVRLTPFSGSAQRIGISGVPGVGKSTFIDTFGTMLTGRGHRVAVIAIDPSSTVSGGSILGDKTRMAKLSYDRDAYIRPSPTSGTLGGVTRATREAIVVVEAAGFDIVIVETVGVGQSETSVAEMVDCFVVLLLARSGDSLQGIKKGVLELADIVAINKADGEHVHEAKLTARELADAMHLLQPTNPDWFPPVLTCSALADTGLDDIWAQITAHRATLERTGALAEKRNQQQVRWMWAAVEERLMGQLRNHHGVRTLTAELTAALRAGATTPTLAATAILSEFESPDT
ncbi:MAG: ATPase/protein kinase [Ilumatobacteraceae bacterium]|nr:ATPase/protein kinase [Ilumatobacteraceae bacterium]